jgi:hypothetical protein
MSMCARARERAQRKGIIKFPRKLHPHKRSTAHAQMSRQTPQPSPSSGFGALKMRSAIHQFLLRQREARNWIAETFHEHVPEKTEDFQRYLEDGVILCKLINHIVPGSIPNAVVVLLYRHKGRREENLAVFLETCKKLDIDKDSLFTVQDILNRTNYTQVIKCLHALARLARRENPRLRRLRRLKQEKAPHMFDEREMLRASAILKETVVSNTVCTASPALSFSFSFSFSFSPYVRLLTRTGCTHEQTGRPRA